MLILLEAAKQWARERNIGYSQRWLSQIGAWELVLHFGKLGSVEVNVADWMPKAVVHWEARTHRASTPTGMRQVLQSILTRLGNGRVCRSPRHTDRNCPACNLGRAATGRKRAQAETTRELPPEDVKATPDALGGPRTVEEAEAELERLMRGNASPDALRAAGARLDALLEKRPLN
ncbi:MAG: hypothetical protein ACXVCX_21470 [Ktedonobacterales bacterium]